MTSKSTPRILIVDYIDLIKVKLIYFLITLPENISFYISDLTEHVKRSGVWKKSCDIHAVADLKGGYRSFISHTHPPPPPPFKINVIFYHSGLFNSPIKMEKILNLGHTPSFEFFFLIRPWTCRLYIKEDILPVVSFLIL